jgi:hypothetical protein
MAEPTFDDAGGEIDPNLIDPDLMAQLEEIDPELFAQLQAVDEEADPTLLERGISRYAIDPELTPEKLEGLPELTDISAALEGRAPSKPSAEMEALGLAGVEQGLTAAGERASQAALNMTTTDPLEIADILTTRFPEDVDVMLSPEGDPVVTNKHTNEQFVINRPGMSAMDVLQGAGLILTYTPAGKWALAPMRAMTQGLTGEAKKQALKSVSRRTAGRAVASEGATEYALQKAQEAAGGRMDPGEVAFSAVTGLLPEYVMTPVGSLGRKVYDIAKDNVVIPGGIASAIDYARRTGRKIATSDVLMETIKAPRRIFLKAAERIPLIGTSGTKLRQAKERLDSLESIFSHFDLQDNDYSRYIAGSFMQSGRRVAASINSLRTQAFERLSGSGNINPRSFMNMIDDQLEAASKLEPDQRRPLMNYLNSVRQDFEGIYRPDVSALQPGAVADIPPTMPFSFKDADLFLNSLMEGTMRAGPKGEMKQSLADALMKDMHRFAKESNVLEGWNKWDLARSLGLREMKEIEDKALKAAVRDGRADAGLIDRLLATGRTTDLNSLYKHTDDVGHELIRARTMAEVFRKAGGDLSDINMLATTVDPRKIVNVLKNDKPLQRAMKRFWTGDDRELVDGWMNYLEQTNKASKALEGMGLLAAGASEKGGRKLIMGTIAALMPPTWGIVSAARMHESDYARDLLLQLNHADITDIAARSILAELRPIFIGLGQDIMQDDRDPFAPTTEATTFEKILGRTGMGGKKIYDAVSGFVGPGIESSIDYLRGVTGLGGDEEEAP